MSAPDPTGQYEVELGDGCYRVLDPGGEVLTTVEGGTQGMDKANAETIASALNARDELDDLRRDLIDALEGAAAQVDLLVRTMASPLLPEEVAAAKVRDALPGLLAELRDAREKAGRR